MLIGLQQEVAPVLTSCFRQKKRRRDNCALKCRQVHWEIRTNTDVEQMELSDPQVAGLEVLTAVNIKISVFYNKAPCSSVTVNCRFVGTYLLCLLPDLR